MEYTISKQIHKIPPIFFPLLFYGSGVMLFFSYLQPYFSWFVGGICLLLWAALALFFRNNEKAFVLIFISFFALLGIFRSYHYISHTEHFPYSSGRQEVAIRGVVQSYSYHPDARFKHCITLLAHSIQSSTETIPVNHSLQIYCRTKPSVSIADEIEVYHLRLKRSQDNDFSFYLLKEGICGSTFVEHLQYLLIMRPYYSINRYIAEKREQLFNLFKESLSPQTFALFSSLFLGYRETPKREKEAMQSTFKQWGISHYLARSGLHLVIIVSLSEFILRFIPVAFLIKQLLLLIAVLMYFLLTWSSVSFLRALFIFAAYKLCILYRTPTHFLHVLLLCCLVLLISNPLYLYFLDFQLSFGLTFAMAWLNQFKTTPNEQC